MADQVVIQVTENKTINVSDVLGNLKLADAAPTVQGLYILSDVGIYANLGGLVTAAEKLNYAYFDGTTWSKVEVEMPYNGGIKQYDEDTAYKANETFVKGNDLYKMKPDYVEMPAGTEPETSTAFLKISSEIRHKANTLAEINDNINFPADTLAVVMDDPNPNNNGIYKKVSSEYSGGWVKTNFVNPVFSKPLTESIAIGGGHTSIWQDEPGTGQGHTALGFEAGLGLGNCWATTLIGWKAGRALSNKSVTTTWVDGGIGNTGNTFIGYNVGSAANGALDNTLVGTSTGQNLTTGMDNAGFGIWSLRLIEAGSENAGFGHLSLGYLVGKGSSYNIDSKITDINSPQYSWGHRNVGVGDKAGALDNGGNPLSYVKKCVYVGCKTTGSSNYVVNENVFGYMAQGRGSNTVSIGNNEVKETHFHGILANWTDRRFADLPTPNRALLGARSFILDANTRVFDAIVSGGGSNLVPVWCDGSSWRVG